MEKYIELSNSEHCTLISKLVEDIEKSKIYKVLDAGSGKTSLSILLKLFPNCEVDAIVFYNDLRKINSIKENVVSNRYFLKEKDICKDKIEGSYDLVLAHLLLGEAKKWGNKFEDLLLNLTKIDSKYLIIYDLKEDISIDYDYLEQILSNNFIVMKKVEISKNTPQQYEDFLGKTYVAYLLEKKTNSNPS